MEENASLKKQLADRVIELELKKRQLEVEAALDNVRLRAGVMRSSSELGEASAVLFQQLNELGINAIRTAVGIFDDPNEAMELWLTSYADNGETKPCLRISRYQGSRYLMRPNIFIPSFFLMAQSMWSLVSRSPKNNAKSRFALPRYLD